MTHIEPLSARIAALEQQAANLPELRDLKNSIEHEISRQHLQLADVNNRIMEGEHARLILNHLTDQTDRVMAGEKLSGLDEVQVSVISRELPEAHELAEFIDSDAVNNPPEIDSTTDVNSTSIPVELALPQEPPASAKTEEPTEPAPPQPLSNRERIRLHIEQHPGQRLAQLMEALDLPKGTVSGSLSAMKADKRLTSVDGQWYVTGQESLTSVIAPADENDQPEPSLLSALTENEHNPPAADPADDQEQHEPDLTPAATIVDARPSKKARVLEVLERDPARSWTVTILAVEADMDEDDVRYGLTNLQNQFLAHAVPGTSPREYRLGKSSDVNAQAQSTSTLPPIPAKLSTDECEVFDTLRKLPEGLTQKLLTHRLNWTNARTEKAVQSLVKYGHIGHHGDKLRVIPPEMQGESA